MSKTTIGLIINSANITDGESERFKIAAEKTATDLVIFNAAEEINLEKIKKQADTCDIILNDDGDYISIELAKTLEMLGHKVVELSETFYYIEDKWLQYLRCKEGGVPVPETILLSTNIPSAKKELHEFGKFPVVLKRVEGCRGEFVDKADDISGAVAVINKFWEKGEDKFPILAQEFIDSDSYRVLTIAGEPIQTAVKKRSSWKATGGNANRFWKFKIDDKLQKILDKSVKTNNIVFCGYDFAKKGDDWVLIEVNSVPSYKFFDCDYENIIEKVLTHLKKIAHSHHKTSR